MTEYAVMNDSKLEKIMYLSSLFSIFLWLTPPPFDSVPHGVESLDFLGTLGLPGIFSLLEKSLLSNEVT